MAAPATAPPTIPISIRDPFEDLPRLISTRVTVETGRVTGDPPSERTTIVRASRAERVPVTGSPPAAVRSRTREPTAIPAPANPPPGADPSLRLAAAPRSASFFTSS
jgi:hypothetical protein